MKLKFKEIWLKQEDEAAFTPQNVVIFYCLWIRFIATEFKHWFNFSGFLFEGVKLTKNSDPYKYSFSGYGIGFNTQIEYLLPDPSIGKNVIIFGDDICSSRHIDNKARGILIFGKGVTKRLNHTLLVETQYSINFTRPDIKFCLSLVYNGNNSFMEITVNATKIYQFKQTSLK